LFVDRVGVAVRVLLDVLTHFNSFLEVCIRWTSKYCRFAFLIFGSP
jgi:hypothetical protein